MNGAYLALACLEAAGLTVWAERGRIRWRGPQPPAELLGHARQHRDAILELLRLRLADPRREAVAERQR